jgi:hypothetical protein
MIYPRTRVLIGLVLVVCPAGLLKGEEPVVAGIQQVLLLRNGQALEGKISRSGDLYYVDLPDGEIRVKAADVEMVCKNFEEGYARKRAAVQIGSLRDRLELVEWCQRQRLYDHAAAELADAAAIAPKNPLVGLLQRRLQMALAPPPAPPQAQSGGEQSPSNEELDRMVRSLPREAVENFTQSVQPLLLNSCTASGCHGPQSESGLRLERALSGQPASRRMTQKNLHAALQFVDRENPLSSRLLTVPTNAHGTCKTAIFSEKDIAQYKRLVDWVLQLGPASGGKTPGGLDSKLIKKEMSAMESPATRPRIWSQNVRTAWSSRTAGSAGATAGVSANSWMDNPAATGVTAGPQSMPGSPAAATRWEDLGAEVAGNATQAAFQEPASDQDKSAKSESSTDSARAKIKRGASQPWFVPQDAFDPEIFNRRYFSAQNPEKAGAVPSPPAKK